MITRILKITALLIIFAGVGGVSAFLTITFIIKGEDTVVVPALGGKEVIDVLKLLTDLGLNTKVGGAEYNGEVPLNHVIFQDPPAGTELKKGRDVRIVVSKGVQTFPAPDVQGLSIGEGLIVLEQNGLCQGKSAYAAMGGVKKDKIVAQAPRPGRLVKRGDCLDLLVSAGSRPPAFKMPELEGRLLEEAILLIERNNLLLGDIKSVYKRDKPLNVVIGQAPPMGFRVIEGTVVNLETNRKMSAGDQPDMDVRRGVSLLRYNTGYGFLKSRIRVRVERSGLSYDIFDDFVRPGSRSWFLIPKGEAARVLVYKDSELVESHEFNN